MEASSYFVGSFFAHIAALAVMASSLPDMKTLEDEVEDDQQYRVQYDYPGITVKEDSRSEECGGRCGWDAMGDSDALDSGHRYGVAGPADNPDPHVSYFDDGPDVGWEYGPGAASLAIGTEAPVVPWGRDDALGTDSIDGRGNMWGEEIGSSMGNDGTGIGEMREEEASSSYGYRCRLP